MFCLYLYLCFICICIYVLFVFVFVYTQWTLLAALSETTFTCLNIVSIFFICLFGCCICFYLCLHYLLYFAFCICIFHCSCIFICWHNADCFLNNSSCKSSHIHLLDIWSNSFSFLFCFFFWFICQLDWFVCLFDWLFAAVSEATSIIFCTFVTVFPPVNFVFLVHLSV